MTTASYEADRRRRGIRLSTIGSQGRLEVAPSAMPEAADGVTLWFRWAHCQNPTAVTLTPTEGRLLVGQLLKTLSRGASDG